MEAEVKKMGEMEECRRMMGVQLEWKERDKERKKLEGLLERQIRELQEKQALEEDQRKKQEEKDRQKMYSQALSYQQNLAQLQKHNFGKMTNNEKRINKEDLGQYKDNQPEVKAIIPGINHLNTTGTAPLKRTKTREAQGPGKLKLSMSMGELPGVNSINSP